MMPELGKYAGAVLSSYGLSLLLMALLVLWVVTRARKTRRALDEVEQRVKRNG